MALDESGEKTGTNQEGHSTYATQDLFLSRLSARVLSYSSCILILFSISRAEGRSGSDSRQQAVSQ